MRLEDHEDRFYEIKNEMDKAIAIFGDRAEPYYFFGEYCCQQNRHDLAYEYLKKAKECNLEHAERNYNLFVNRTVYDTHINDWLSVACFWTNRVEEGKALIMEILDSKELSKKFSNSLDHYNRNLKHFENLEKTLNE